MFSLTKKNYYLFLILFWVSIIQSAPSILGGRGLFKVEDAGTEHTGLLSFSTYFLTHKTSTDTLLGDLIIPTIIYDPSGFLQIFFRAGQIVKTDAVFPQVWQSKFKSSKHDIVVGSKLGITPIPVFKFGGKITYTWPRTYNITGSVIEPSDELSWAGLLALRFSEVYSPLPNLIFNYGEDKNLRNYRFGLEFGENGTIFIEAVSSTPKTAKIFTNITDYLTITPGIRFKIGSHSFLSTGLMMDVANTTIPDYSFILGLTIGGTILKQPVSNRGILTGTVTDAQTGQPLYATITFPDQPKLKPIQSSAQTGIFKAEKLPARVIIAEVSCEGYQKQIIPIVIEADKIVAYDFKLRPLVTYGVIAGNIYDAETKRPLQAEIDFSIPGLPPMTSDSLTGAFRVDKAPTGIITVEAKKEGYFPKAFTFVVEEGKISQLDLPLLSSASRGIFAGKITDKVTQKPLFATIEFTNAMIPSFTSDSMTGVYQIKLATGSYSVVIKALGYLSVTKVIAVEKDKITEENFELVPKQKTIVLKGVYFETNQATLKSESYPVLREAAKILFENPNIKVEIQGHTDNTGSATSNQILSEKRAYAIMNYLVENLGITPDRITAKGYGESQPIADNNTELGRALNRRVEFVILEEEK